MPDDTPILQMPYILPAQAQKHVTHNEALRILDVLVQLIVIDRDQTVPPPTPTEADRHIVPPLATGDWQGMDGQIALWEHGQWSFFVPQHGWSAYVLAEGVMASCLGGAWVVAAEQPLHATQIGISATADAVNRLSVTAPATLLNHDGGGHQLKINKSGPGDTASLLFQSGFSGRAEMGLAGGDDFTIKVSSDGASFLTGVAVDGASGVVSAPMGLRMADGTAVEPGLGFASETGLGLARAALGQMALCAGGAARAHLSAAGLSLSVPLTGTAVTQSASDTAAGRLLKVGDFGLGRLVAFAGDIDAPSALPTGFVRVLAGATGAKPAGTSAFNMLVLRPDATNPYANTSQIAFVDASTEMLTRAWNGTAWSGWCLLFQSSNVVGTVSQSGGVPTGAVVERGSNANGHFTRFADGTQICRSTVTSVSGGALTWTYPAAFVGIPSFTASVGDGALRVATWANRLATSVDINVFDASGMRTVNPVDVQVSGYWF